MGTNKQTQQILARTGEIKIIRFLPEGGLKQDAIALFYQGIMIIVADNGLVLIECTPDGNYAKIFKSVKKLKRYLNETYGIEIEIE